jgi:hypothetical protein
MENTMRFINKASSCIKPDAWHIGKTAQAKISIAIVLILLSLSIAVIAENLGNDTESNPLPPENASDSDPEGDWDNSTIDNPVNDSLNESENDSADGSTDGSVNDSDDSANGSTDGSDGGSSDGSADDSDDSANDSTDGSADDSDDSANDSDDDLFESFKGEPMVLAGGEPGFGILGGGGTDPCDGTPQDADCWSDEAPSTLVWGPEGVTTNAQSNTDGKANTDILVGLAGSYPAAEYCATLTEGDVPAGTWYLPAHDELWAGWQALHGATTFSEQYYWSSTEDSGNPENQARELDTTSNMSSSAKENAGSVRCFRDTVPPSQYTLTINRNPEAGGTVSGAGTFDENSAHAITATPSEGWVFVNWTGTNADRVADINSNSTNFNLTSNGSITANFEEKEFAGGTGSSGNPYQIETCKHLQNMNLYLDNKYYILNDNVDCNIDPFNAGDGFEPIGNNTNKFTGKFNGNSKTISNLFIDRDATDYVGLFGVIGAAGEVKDVSLTSVSVKGKDYVGALVGENEGTILRSHSAGDVVEGVNNVGGLIGQNVGEVANSSSNIPVTGAENLIGGFVGVNLGTITQSLH